MVAVCARRFWAPGCKWIRINAMRCICSFMLRFHLFPLLMVRLLGYSVIYIDNIERTTALFPSIEYYFTSFMSRIPPLVLFIPFWHRSGEYVSISLAYAIASKYERETMYFDHWREGYFSVNSYLFS